MRTKKVNNLKGFRNFLPEDQTLKNYLVRTLKQVFEAYGFEPLETPAIEYASTLLGKYGNEADKLVYTFKDKGDRLVGLRYDLTVPLAKVLSQNSGQIPLPFKRYQIQNVWRAEKPQAGRFREFLQCDVDIVGTNSPLAEAEIIALTVNCFKKLGLENFEVKINSRQVLFSLLNELNIKEKKQQMSFLQTLDKLEKMGPDKVKAELLEKGFREKIINKLFTELKTIKPDENLKKIFDLLSYYGINEKNYSFSPTLVRGLDYYTGPIFEVVLKNEKISSLAGGGRYDELIPSLGGPDISGTGLSFGLDRIINLLKEKKQLAGNLKTKKNVLVLTFSDLLKENIKTLTQLRKNGILGEIYLKDSSFKTQLKYADKKGVSWVIIQGPDEIKAKVLTLKGMNKKEQKKLKLEEIIRILKDS